MSEYPPEFLRRLKAINQRRFQLMKELGRNYDRDLRSIQHTIGLEIDALCEEMDVQFVEEEEE